MNGLLLALWREIHLYQEKAGDEMAVSKITFRSDVLGKATSINVYLPEHINQGELMPVIYLLHGWSDNEDAWLSATSLERYASSYPFAIVMPNVDLSYYTDMVHGNRYWTFISEELPQLVQKWFQVSAQKEDTFVAGLSMGGYGATKLALSHPERFNGVASLSGAMDIVSLWKRDPSRNKAFSDIFGSIESLEGSNNDLFPLLKRQHPTESVGLLQICGTEDFLYQDNLNFKKAAESKLARYRYLEMSGDHNWEFWDKTIQIVLKWFNEQRSHLR